MNVDQSIERSSGLQQPVVTENVTTGYGRKPVIENVSLTINQGVTVLAGPNGAGKSTLLKLLASLIPIRSGSVRVAGMDMTNRSQRRKAMKSIGYLPQSPAFPGRFTTYESLRYAAWLQKLSTEEAKKGLSWVREQLALDTFWNKKLDQLSGGMRQRVFLGQVLVHGPSVIFLDEPTAEIDPTKRAEFRQIVKEIAVGRTVIVTSHMVEDMERLADRIVILGNASIAFDGTPSDLVNLSSSKTGDTRSEADEHPIERSLRQLELRN